VPSDEQILTALRRGDERAFVQLVECHQALMLRVARRYVRSSAVAEEVVQETWVGVLRGLGRFERRSSFRTWLFQIALNQARTRGERERRTIPFASLADREVADDTAAVDPDRFLGADHDRWPHHWATPPRRWDESPERYAESEETLARVREAIERLPPAQRVVITLRDIYGCDSAEVCNALDLTETNQRVLLHRARSRVRADLESYFADV
jgi:RNA polymerase sigma-70 factor, ECF subfamily